MNKTHQDNWRNTSTNLGSATHLSKMGKMDAGKMGAGKMGKMGFFRSTHLSRTHLELWKMGKMGFQKDGKDGSERWERWVFTKHFHSRVHVFLKIPKNKYFFFQRFFLNIFFSYHVIIIKLAFVTDHRLWSFPPSEKNTIARFQPFWSNFLKVEKRETGVS